MTRPKKLLPPDPNKRYQMREDNWYNIREFFTPAKGKHGAHLTLKCGDCDEKLVIYFGDDDLVEINGVMGTIANWKEIFHKIAQKCKQKDTKINW